MKDWNRYNLLQKHYQLLNEYDSEKLDDLEYAIYDSFYKKEDKEEVEKLFEQLNLLIESAKNNIIKKSKKYL